MKNRLVLPALITGIALVVAVYIATNYFISQQSFTLKQKCHDEATTYVENQRITLEKQIKFDNSTESVGLILDGYNKDLNTCLVIFAVNTLPDTVKYPSLGPTYTEYINDALTGKIIDFWWKDYNHQTYAEELSGGSIRGKTTSNRNDFNNEIDILFGKNSGGYIDPPSTSTIIPKNTPTPTTVQSQNDSVLPSWCQGVIEAYAGSYSRATINQLMKKDHPECAY